MPNQNAEVILSGQGLGVSHADLIRRAQGWPIERRMRKVQEEAGELVAAIARYLDSPSASLREKLAEELVGLENTILNLGHADHLREPEWHYFGPEPTMRALVRFCGNYIETGKLSSCWRAWECLRHLSAEFGPDCDSVRPRQLLRLKGALERDGL